jgi:hypothetical protein
MVLYSAATRADAARAISQASAAAAAMGVAAGLILLGAGMALSGSTGSALIALSPCIPFLLVQDLGRYGYVMTGNAPKACLSDGVWLVIATGGLMALRISDTRSVTLAVLAWGAGSVPGAMALARQVLGSIHVRRPRAWLDEVGSLSIRYAADFIVVAASGYLMILFVAAIDSLDHAAAIRGAQVLLGPTTVAFLGASMYFVPETARVAVNGVRGVRRLARMQSIVLMAFTAAWLILVMAAPDSIGTRLFGASWDGAQERLPLVGLAFIGNAAFTGPVSGVRAMKWAGRGLVLRVISAVVVLLATAAGATYSVPTGALTGFAIGSWVAAACWWAGLLKRSVDEMAYVDHEV